MRRVLALGVALLVVAAPPALAARKKTATVDGRVTLGSSNEPVRGAEVTLLGARLDGTGEVVEKTVSSDAGGRFEFEVPKREGIEFALEARYDGGTFVGASFPIKGGGVTSNLEVWKTTSDSGVITIERDHMFVAHDEQGAGVLESITVRNDSDEAYTGRGRALGAEQSDESPTLGFALPTQSVGQRVDLIDSSLNRLYAIDASFGFAATVAIPPGETTVTFAFPASGDAGNFDLTRRTLYPTEELSVFVTDPLEVEAGRLSPDGTRDVSGESYRVWTSTNEFDAGDVVSLLVIAEGNTSSNLWLGLGVGLGVIVLLIALGVWLRSRSRRRAPVARATAPKPAMPADDDLVAAIAALDLEHESGDLSEDEWRERRVELKNRLVASKERETTP
jgi:hypothetical protein